MRFPPYDSPEYKKREFEGLCKSLARRYGEDIGPWLARRVAVMFRRIDDACVDNFRVADLSRPDEVEVYDKQRARGCCGRYDDRITHFKSGRTFRFGCNYGH